MSQIASVTKINSFVGHKDRVWCTSWSPCGTSFASCSGDLSVIIWKCKNANMADVLEHDPTQLTWEKTQVLNGDHTKSIRCVSWCPTGKRLATASFDRTVIIYQLIDGDFEAVATLEGHDSEVKWVAWNPSGDMIATCSRDKTIWIWHEDSEGEWECISVLTGHSQDVKQIRFLNESTLLSASYDDSIKIWKEDEDDWYNEHTLNVHSSTVWSIAIDNEKKHIACASADCSVSLFEYNKELNNDLGNAPINQIWKKITVIPEIQDRPLYSIDWSAPSETYPSGIVAIGGGSDDLTILKPVTNTENNNITDLTQLNVVKGAHDNDINCVSFNPKYPSLLLSSSDDKNVTIWLVK